MNENSPMILAARNKANYLKAKELFNQKKIQDCLLYYAADHKVKSIPSTQGRDGIRLFFENLHDA